MFTDLVLQTCTSTAIKRFSDSCACIHLLIQRVAEEEHIYEENRRIKIERRRIRVCMCTDMSVMQMSFEKPASSLT